MTEKLKYVLLFRGAKEDTQAATNRVELLPDLVVLNRSSFGALRVECASDLDIAAAIQETGDWLVSEERVYHLS
jgi:hypothetical protein